VSLNVGREGTGVAVDTDGNIYLTGAVTNESLPVVNAFQPQQRGRSDAFVAKLDHTGKKLIYLTYLGGSGLEMASGIAVDSRGYAFVAGYTEPDDFPVKAALQGTAGGRGDAFLAKFAPDGGLKFATYLGGREADSVESVAVDAAGVAVVAGSTYSSDFPLRGAIRTAMEVREIFYTRVCNDGSQLLYSTFLSGSKDEVFGTVATPPNGDAYVAMRSDSRDVIGTDNFLSIPAAENLVLLRLTAAISATPAQVS
jgi:hypothetical protein